MRWHRFCCPCLEGGGTIDVITFGPVFVREVERDKETVQLGRVLKLLAELGIELKADVPEDVVAAFVALRLTGVKPLKPRRPGSKAATTGTRGGDGTPTDELK